MAGGVCERKGLKARPVDLGRGQEIKRGEDDGLCWQKRREAVCEDEKSFMKKGKRMGLVF